MEMGEAEAIGSKIHKLLNGSIVVLALLTVLESNALTEWRAIAIILMTLVAHAVSEAFSRGVADEIVRKRRPAFLEMLVLLRSSLIVVVPGIVPLVAFAAVAAGWLPLGMAFAAACWILVLGLFAAGFMACKAGGGKVWRGLGYGLVISTFGLGIVALRLMAH